MWSKSNENGLMHDIGLVQKPGKKFSPKTAFLDTLIMHVPPGSYHLLLPRDPIATGPLQLAGTLPLGLMLGSAYRSSCRPLGNRKFVWPGPQDGHATPARNHRQRGGETEEQRGQGRHTKYLSISFFITPSW